ncbi:MAG: manganese efflux pump [Desulfobacterales bacterium]
MSGRYILVWAETWGPWISFILLMFIGTRMVVEGLKSTGEKEECCDPTKGMRSQTINFFPLSFSWISFLPFQHALFRRSDLPALLSPR